MWLSVRAPNLTAFHITGADPPAIVNAWSVERGNGGCGSPFVTSTDGANNMIVWLVGTEPTHGTGGDQRLHGYDGDTGAVLYDGGGLNELIAGTHKFNAGIAAARAHLHRRGRQSLCVCSAEPADTNTHTNA